MYQLKQSSQSFFSDITFLLVCSDLFDGNCWRGQFGVCSVRSEYCILQMYFQHKKNQFPIVKWTFHPNHWYYTLSDFAVSMVCISTCKHYLLVYLKTLMNLSLKCLLHRDSIWLVSIIIFRQAIARRTVTQRNQVKSALLDFTNQVVPLSKCMTLSTSGH